MKSVNHHDRSCRDIQAKEEDDSSQTTLLIQPSIHQTHVIETKTVAVCGK